MQAVGTRTTLLEEGVTRTLAAVVAILLAVVEAVEVAVVVEEREAVEVGSHR